MSPKEVNTFVVNFRNLVHKIYNLSVPVVVAIDGIAVGMYFFEMRIIFVTTFI